MCLKVKKDECNKTLNSLHSSKDRNFYIYTDGSCRTRRTNKEEKCISVSSSAIYVYNNKILGYDTWHSTNDEDTACANVSGEIQAVYWGLHQAKIKYCKYKKIRIVSDYIGVQTCINNKEANIYKTVPYANELRTLVIEMKNNGYNIEAIHIYSHSSCKNSSTFYNFLADTLAGNKKSKVDKIIEFQNNDLVENEIKGSKIKFRPDVKKDTRKAITRFYNNTQNSRVTNYWSLGDASIIGTVDKCINEINEDIGLEDCYKIMNCIMEKTNGKNAKGLYRNAIRWYYQGMSINDSVNKAVFDSILMNWN